MTIDEIDPEDNLHQRINELEMLISAMTISRDPSGLDALALDVARDIENIFAQGHIGGRSQRLAKIQCVVRNAIKMADPTLFYGKRQERSYHVNKSSRTRPHQDLRGV